MTIFRLLCSNQQQLSFIPNASLDLHSCLLVEGASKFKLGLLCKQQELAQWIDTWMFKGGA